MTLYWIIVYDVSEDLAASIFGLQIILPLNLEDGSNKILQNICIYLPGGMILSHKTSIFTSIADVRSKLYSYV
jgi:hypothetical protein